MIYNIYIHIYIYIEHLDTPPWRCLQPRAGGRHVASNGQRAHDNGRVSFDTVTGLF